MLTDTQEKRISELLKQGLDHTGLMVGILSLIKGNNYTVVTCQPGGAIDTGTGFDLPETVCTLVCESQKPVSFHNAISVGFDTHPAYDKFSIEAYIGAPVHVIGEFYGTLNFSDVNERQKPFTAEDEAFVAELANQAGAALAD